MDHQDLLEGRYQDLLDPGPYFDQVVSMAGKPGNRSECNFSNDILFVVKMNNEGMKGG